MSPYRRWGDDLEASLADLQWVVNGYTLTLAAFVLLGGALGDRVGRRKVFLVGVIWFTIASFACGLAQSPSHLIVARVLQGIGAALLVHRDRLWRVRRPLLPARHLPSNVLGYSALLAGLETWPIALLLMVGSARSGALAARIGPRTQLVAGPFLCATGAALMRRADETYWTTTFPGVLIFAVGLTLLVAPLTTTVLAALEDRFAGVASGINDDVSGPGSAYSAPARPTRSGNAATASSEPARVAALFSARPRCGQPASWPWAASLP